MSFATEALENLDEVLADIQGYLESGDTAIALQGVKLVRDRIPNLLRAVQLDEEQRYG